MGCEEDGTGLTIWPRLGFMGRDCKGRGMKRSSRGQVDPFIVMDVMEEARGLEAAGRSIIHMEVGQPGTPAFRTALRDALEGVKEVAGAHGIFNMSANDHLGLDQRGRVMVKIQGGKWVYQP